MTVMASPTALQYKMENGVIDVRFGPESHQCLSFGPDLSPEDLDSLMNAIRANDLPTLCELWDKTFPIDMPCPDYDAWLENVVYWLRLYLEGTLTIKAFHDNVYQYTLPPQSPLDTPEARSNEWYLRNN